MLSGDMFNTVVCNEVVSSDSKNLGRTKVELNKDIIKPPVKVK